MKLEPPAGFEPAWIVWISMGLRGHYLSPLGHGGFGTKGVGNTYSLCAEAPVAERTKVMASQTH